MIQTSPVEVESFSFEQSFFCSNKFAAGYVSENVLYTSLLLTFSPLCKHGFQLYYSDLIYIYKRPI